MKKNLLALIGLLSICTTAQAHVQPSDNILGMSIGSKIEITNDINIKPYTQDTEIGTSSYSDWTCSVRVNGVENFNGVENYDRTVLARTELTIKGYQADKNWVALLFSSPTIRAIVCSGRHITKHMTVGDFETLIQNFALLKLAEPVVIIP